MILMLMVPTRIMVITDERKNVFIVRTDQM